MDENNYSHPDTVPAEELQPLPELQPFQPFEPLPRRFRFRTVLLPILFLGLHFAVSTVIAAIYAMAFILLTSINQPDLLSIMQDPEQLNAILLQQFPVISVFIAAALIPVYLIFLKLSQRRDPRSLLTNQLRGGDMWPALAMMVGAMGLTNIWFNLLTMIQESSPVLKGWMTEYTDQAEAFSPEVGYFWLILGVCILTPVAEELLFRGIVQGELRKAMPEWAAIIIQAVIFAAFHMQPIQISYVLLPGLLLGLAYYWSKSIWVPIGMHCLYNFLGSVVPAMIGNDETMGNILGISEMAFILVGLLAVIYFYLNHRREQQINSPQA